MLAFSRLIISWWFFFFTQKTAYEMRISDWSSDVCSSDLTVVGPIAWGKGPVKNVAKTPLVGGQWRQGGAFKYDLVITSNETAPSKIGRASCRESVWQYVSISVVDV